MEHVELYRFIRTTIYLMQRITAMTYISNMTEGFGFSSLGIRPLSELIDVYHLYEASDRRDKVFALLGMSSDNPSAEGFVPDYQMPWSMLLSRVVNMLFGDAIKVSTWDDEEIAIIQGKCRIFGKVTTVDDLPHAGQDHFFYVVSIHDNHTVYCQSLAPVQCGDICCFIDGASLPSIVRPCEDYCRLIVSALHKSVSGPTTDTQMASVDTLMVWNLNQGPSQPAGNTFDLEGFLSNHGLENRNAEKTRVISPKHKRVANLRKMLEIMGRQVTAPSS